MRKLLTAVVLLLCVLAVGGASRKSTYGGGTYGIVGGTYQAGGAHAGRDTITIVFTTQDVLTAGVLDTTKVGTASSRSAPYDSQRRDTFKFWLAQADTIHRLGAGFKVTNFAYGVVDSTEPEGYAYASGYQVGLLAGLRVGAGPYTHNRTFAASGRRAELFYIPYEKYIPSGSTIVGAHVNVSGNTASNATTADSVYANLITSADNKWYTAKRGGAVADYSKMGWSRQISNNPTGAVTWSATNSNPWSTALSLRTGFRSWGDVEDQAALPGAVGSRQQLVFSLKNCVQAAVTGATNNGTILNLGWKTNEFQGGLNHAFWDDTSDATARTPYVVIRYIRRQYVGDADIAAPGSPTSLSAVAGEGAVSLAWSDTGPGTVAFNVYRFFDGGDTTKIASGVGNPYTDATAINGSSNNYLVTAVDRSGNESGYSNSASATPVSPLVVEYPAYYALWFQDPNDDPLSSAQLDSLAIFDAVITGPFAFEPGEDAYTGIATALRSRNSDIVLLAYWHPWTPMAAWAISPSGSAQKRTFDWLVANDGLAHNVSGGVATGDVYSTFFVDVDNAGIAEALAEILVDEFEESGINEDYCGLFLDDQVTDIPASLCNSGDCQAYLDFDRDGNAYEVDSDDSAAFMAYHEKFVKAVRSEFAQRGLSNRLIVANSDFGRTDPVSPDEASYLARCDGVMVEGYNLWWPGDGANESTWELAFGVSGHLTNSQVSPPLAMFQARADSSIYNMSEPVAMANNSWVCAWSQSGGIYGNLHIPYMGERLPVSGDFVSRDIIANPSGPDTLVVVYENYTLYSILGDAYVSPYAIWAYRVATSLGPVLTLSFYW